MIRSALFNWSARFAHYLSPIEETYYHVMEYHGILHGWTITATRKGWDRAELLKKRCEMARPEKLFKIQQDIIDLPFTA
jgi:hypothetical protein